MCKELNYSLVECSNINNSALYQLKDKNAFVISNAGTRKLLCEPEIIGYTIPKLLLEPITDILSWLRDEKKISSVSILNILRGGLNFPIEEASYLSSINVKGISFITSERFFLDKKVSRIETRYRKIIPVDNSSIVIGDIIASGETLRNAINYIEETYVVSNVSLKNIIILTIGTKNTLALIDDFEKQLQSRWPDFESIIVFFFEGIFNTYDNTGISGLNLPKVDFYINKAIVSPDYRKTIIDKQTAIFEKCAIYDGGARRFEPSEHIRDLIKYWTLLNNKASNINTQDFLEEKYGYNSSISYDNWKFTNHYYDLSDDIILEIYYNEIDFLKGLETVSFGEITCSRYNELTECFCSR